MYKTMCGVMRLPREMAPGETDGVISDYSRMFTGTLIINSVTSNSKGFECHCVEKQIANVAHFLIYFLRISS